jgi:hypothetical protein
MLFAGIIISTLFSILIPLVVVVLIVRLIAHHRGSGPKRPFLQFREVILGSLILAAGFCGVAGLYALPVAIFGPDEEFSTQVLVMHLVSAIVLLILGLFVKQVTGKFLMVVGLILLLGAFGPAFEALGSAGALIAVVVAFIVLIGVTVYVSRKASKNG